VTSEAAPPRLRSPAGFLGFELVSRAGKRRRDRRVERGEGTAVLTARALRFTGERRDQEVAIPVEDIHGVEIGSSHNGRRFRRGTVVKVSFGGGEARVLGLHLRAEDATEWRRLLLELTGGGGS